MDIEGRTSICVSSSIGSKTTMNLEAALSYCKNIAITRENFELCSYFAQEAIAVGLLDQSQSLFNRLSEARSLINGDQEAEEKFASLTKLFNKRVSNNYPNANNEL